MPPSGDLPDLGIESGSRMSPSLAGEFLTISTTWEAWRERYIFTLIYKIHILAIIIWISTVNFTEVSCIRWETSEVKW